MNNEFLELPICNKLFNAILSEYKNISKNYNLIIEGKLRIENKEKQIYHIIRDVVQFRVEKVRCLLKIISMLYNSEISLEKVEEECLSDIKF